jgi:hypothetical protein
MPTLDQSYIGNDQGLNIKTFGYITFSSPTQIIHVSHTQ